MKAKPQLRYREKADDSFRTKLNMYLFDKATSKDWENVSLNDFVHFKITQELVHLYTTEYWQYEPEHKLKNNLTNDEVYRQISQKEKELAPLIEEFRKDYIEKRFPDIFPVEVFREMVESAKHCEYCGISIEEILMLADRKQLHKKNYRGWSFEIDRIDSNFEYKRDNCVMACYWCNNAKTDEFTLDEFKLIAKEIGGVWERRMKGMGSH